MPRLLPTRYSMGSCLCLAAAVAGFGGQASAQDSTPVRQLGQSSPGFIPSFSLQSEKLRRSQQDLPTFITDQPGVSPAGGPPARKYEGPVPWWEGTEAVTL